MTTSTHHRSAFPTVIGIAAVVFALDQATKFLVLKHIPLGGSWSLYPTLARLAKFTFITNTGAAFGMFPQLSLVFLLIAFAVVILLVFLILSGRLPVESAWVRVSLGLLVGGA